MNILKLFFISSNPKVASFAISEGVDQIFLDLELIGKIERQGHLDTVISGHSMSDISILRSILPAGTLLVRLNPFHSHTESEVNEAISRGADKLMLPMFRSVYEVKKFCRYVDSRAQVCLLVETVDAMRCLDECIKISGVTEVHIGLNDLHIEMGLRFILEPFVLGYVEQMADILRFSAMPFGIGGLARIGDGLVPAELLIAEHVRLGSGAAILSRSFHRKATTLEDIQMQMDFGQEVQSLRSVYKTCLSRSKGEAELQHKIFIDKIKNVVALI